MTRHDKLSSRGGDRTNGKEEGVSEVEQHYPHTPNDPPCGCPACVAVRARSEAPAMTQSDALVERLREALKPLAKLADTWTVEAAALQDTPLIVSNGQRMFGIEAAAFVRARAALADLDSLTARIADYQEVEHRLGEALEKLSAAEARLAAAERERDELETKVADAYQIVGAITHYAGFSDAPDVVRALDHLSDIRFVDDILPWPKERLVASSPLPPAAGELDGDAGAKLLAGWINYSWDDMKEGRIGDKGYPQWCYNGAGHLYFQGGKQDLRDLAGKIAALARRAAKEETRRLWDAISWLHDYDPEHVVAMEAKFGLDFMTRPPALMHREATMAGKWSEDMADRLADIGEQERHNLGFRARLRNAALAALEEARREAEKAMQVNLSKDVILHRNRNIKTGEKRILSRLQNPSEAVIEAAMIARHHAPALRDMGRGAMKEALRAAAAVLAAEGETPQPHVQTVAPGDPWPEGVSDGLTLGCGICGRVPDFDYRVSDEVWDRVAPSGKRLGVICLRCLDRSAVAQGEDISGAIAEVQFTGDGKTVVLRPVRVIHYRRAAAESETQPPAPGQEGQ